MIQIDLVVIGIRYLEGIIVIDEQKKRAAMEAISRASQAEELLNNPLYVEAITAMKGKLLLEFQDTKTGDEKVRHELWQRMQLMNDFEKKFRDIVKYGEKGRQTLSMLERAKEMVGL